ncbi:MULTISPECIES: hypothetical protein [Chryseobacterium]|uniref:Trimeric autotransporter adhesin YadA-like head domain-containing protein n=1 Tax=Chryseobacterium camelliae TaxID=1265445 RepID=A0ABU0TMB8_9FLAO|nr:MULTISPECIES: hypothetical protein [Chryseobacterium]MDT3407948.1 hypothetical protein [Pseudacidovorax intermedius]MDQ1098192.1 hypothetical protein [Chryseobacterium camelliae]MDQ1102122.1 hypothetical protein [Chryseobacterium sp. SORGH_AS_1048]MDR6085560.1 hypothetical protein [Chryseobacterium sp. SORGH_AS_0909]MDR6129922.1 hypothetical protein [Chryseobacterium sp. SORGH_AS_1175]
MIRHLLTASTLLLSIITYSQVGINNQNPKVTLDITAKTSDGSKPEGILAPRLTGDQIKAGNAQYGSDQKGTLIYATAAITSSDTKTANITAEGYYYFDGNLWQKVGNTAAASNWNMTGNAGTNPAANFIGTTDAHAFVIKTNNNLAGYIGTAASDNLTLGVDAGKVNTTGNLNVFVGNSAGSANTAGSSNVFVGPYSGTSNTTGNSNVFMGYNSGSSSTTGDANAFVGTWAGNTNTTGGYNAFMGYQAGNSNTSGSNNTFLGYSSGKSNTAGNNNVAVGTLAGQTISTGSNNTFIGTGADADTNNLTNATAIGYGAKVSTSNSLVLGGTGSSVVNVGIGTSSPASRLEVDGASTNKSAYDAGSSTTIDYSKSNLAYTSASAGNFTLQNIKDGGTYTLSVRGTASGTSAFTATGFTFRYVNNNPSIANTHTLYTFMAIGNVVYVYCVRGL